MGISKIAEGSSRKEEKYQLRKGSKSQDRVVARTLGQR